MTKQQNSFLPSIPKSCEEVFKKHSLVITKEQALVLKKEVKDHASKIIECINKRITTCNTEPVLYTYNDVVKKMANALEILLDDYANFSEEEKALIVGAAKYFIEISDWHNDFSDPLGIEDDLAVINTVLIRLNKHNLVIDKSNP